MGCDFDWQSSIAGVAPGGVGMRRGAAKLTLVGFVIIINM